MALLLVACAPARPHVVGESPPWMPTTAPTAALVVRSTGVAAIAADPRELWPEAVTPEPTPTPTPAPTPAVALATAYSAGSIEALICSYPWPCQEALNVARHESGLQSIYNREGSGACGIFQLLPCVCIDPVCNIGYAYAVKWAPTQSFYTHWYRWWN